LRACPIFFSFHQKVTGPVTDLEPLGQHFPFNTGKYHGDGVRLDVDGASFLRPVSLSLLPAVLPSYNPCKW
jgi:hypothetical protein